MRCQGEQPTSDTRCCVEVDTETVATKGVLCRRAARIRGDQRGPGEEEPLATPSVREVAGGEQQGGQQHGIEAVHSLRVSEVQVQVADDGERDRPRSHGGRFHGCLLYTSDAADE